MRGSVRATFISLATRGTNMDTKLNSKEEGRLGYKQQWPWEGRRKEPPWNWVGWSCSRGCLRSRRGFQVNWKIRRWSFGVWRVSTRKSCWRIIRHERPQEVSTAGGLKHLLVVQIPESQVRALAALNDRPFYRLGQVNVRVAGREQEEPVETEGDQGQT